MTFLESIRMDAYYGRLAEGRGAVDAWTSSILGNVCHFVKTLPCRVHGHDFSSISGDPENGVDYLQCRRCGEGFNAQF